MNTEINFNQVQNGPLWAQICSFQNIDVWKKQLVYRFPNEGKKGQIEIQIGEIKSRRQQLG